MKKTFITTLLISSALLNAKIELLDRIAIIVDDGVVMESQINKAMAALEEGYREQNIQLPPKDVLLDQIKERLIIEELQLQLADRAGVKISDAELNSTFSRLASNNQMSLEEFVSFIETNGDSYEEVRETMRKEMRIQRIQRGRVNSNIVKEFEINLLSLASILIKSDGKISASELQFVRNYFISIYGPQKANNLFTRFNKEVDKSNISAEKICVFYRSRTSYETRLQIINLLFNVAKSDGNISNFELEKQFDNYQIPTKLKHKYLVIISFMKKL